MPTYQYACTECGEPLEVVQTFTDDSLTECPSCGGRLRKLFNAVGIVFKGSGFYRTDSRSTTTAGDTATGDAAAKKTDTADKTEKSGTSDKSTAPAAKADKASPSGAAAKPSSSGSSAA